MSNSLHVGGQPGCGVYARASLGVLRATEVAVDVLRLPGLGGAPERRVSLMFQHGTVTVDEQTLRNIVVQGQAWLTAFDAATSATVRDAATS
ncbi:Uncharacterised protein [Mycobacteroides abscessus subsp. massiliense]|uniref:hypothetical protein n=1 Tax=Mycobacteroides abscessus TaxID=36809 RepID=UPI0009A6665D|nr:hypothetical protein [Mycobacteroides abscessus]SKH53319.1 Uncharacterised protein [Mycobacteroides abscessus subsp. massiliense]SKH84131.1 Uncharacterised protein [Mycobacteroides abscessus subsp. massiliense]SKK33753.1 Uncharacterised protein [Mycobacteroides abscessus subsp. massiliense]SKK45616.1 Uncharacterised protein [Mycobacteroides abscessus subsp. massiliense]SKL87232.1 Uncharacterised protein [Mycobacteroides abscessus subsp. massiliense]